MKFENIKKLENSKHFFVRLLLPFLKFNISSDDDDDGWLSLESFIILSIIEIDAFVDFGCQTLLFGCLEWGRSYASA